MVLGVTGQGNDDILNLNINLRTLNINQIGALPSKKKQNFSNSP